MDIFALLDYLETEFEEAALLPFSKKVSVDRQKCLEIIKEMRKSLPEEMERAEAIVKQREQILEDARMQATTQVNQTQAYVRQLISDHEVYRKAEDEAEKMIEKAEQESREILQKAKTSARETITAANTYTDDLLEQLEVFMQKMLVQFDSFLKKQLELVRSNREELRGGKQ